MIYSARRLWNQVNCLDSFRRRRYTTSSSATSDSVSRVFVFAVNCASLECLNLEISWNVSVQPGVDTSFLEFNSSSAVDLTDEAFEERRTRGG